MGLLGSAYYVNNLTPTELSHTAYDLDADVTATPNGVIGILDPAAPDFFGRTVSTTFPSNVYAPSQISRDQSIRYFDSIGEITSCSRRWEPMRSASTRAGSRPAAC